MDSSAFEYVGCGIVIEDSMFTNVLLYSVVRDTPAAVFDDELRVG